MRGKQDVFEISHGLPQLAWRGARWMYHHGASSNALRMVYERIRKANDYNRPTAILKLMGRDIRRRYQYDAEPLVVSHPILVGILSGRAGLIYQHGELVAPRESLVKGAETVIVPTENTAQEFVSTGYRKEQLLISGLCVEPSLVKQAPDACQSRIARIASSESLTGAFFSSGAEPISHVRKIIVGAESAVEHGGRAVVFAQRRKRLAQGIVDHFQRSRREPLHLDSSVFIPAELPSVTLVEFDSRREEEILTARLFASFDYFAAPSHERSNWALGLGLPMFILGPSIGPFAPMNCRLLLEAGVASLLADEQEAASLGSTLQNLRDDGILAQMARRGWSHQPIHGFERIADHLVRVYAASG
jgi:hypothetical protein